MARSVSPLSSVLSLFAAARECIGCDRVRHVRFMDFQLADAMLDRITVTRRLGLRRLTPTSRAYSHTVPLALPQRRFTLRATQPIVRQLIFQRARLEPVDDGPYPIERVQQASGALTDIKRRYYTAQLDNPRTQRGDIDRARTRQSITAQRLDCRHFKLVQLGRRDRLPTTSRVSQNREGGRARTSAHGNGPRKHSLSVPPLHDSSSRMALYQRSRARASRRPCGECWGMYERGRMTSEALLELRSLRPAAAWCRRCCSCRWWLVVSSRDSAARPARLPSVARSP